jgi:hypothetical protein
VQWQGHLQQAQILMQPNVTPTSTSFYLRIQNCVPRLWRGHHLCHRYIYFPWAVMFCFLLCFVTESHKAAKYSFTIVYIDLTERWGQTGHVFHITKQEKMSTSTCVQQHLICVMQLKEYIYTMCSKCPPWDSMGASTRLMDRRIRSKTPG